MYTIYHTEGIVLGGAPVGEASKILYIFTRDFGLVSAHTRSLRELKSKLRYGLQDFSYTHIDLIRGKGGWRVTSAIPIDNLSLAPIRIDYFELISRVFSLVRRLVKGEECNERL